MADHFDPYHRWLAIPPQEQPPNHYRLLGLANLESDADVIESAADRQMAHVRSHKTGKHAEHVDDVLNEIAAAKRVLLDGEKKADYDAQLRLKTAKPAAKAPPLAQPMLPPAGEVPLPPPVPPQNSPVAAPVARPAPPQSSRPQSSSVAPLLFVLLGVAAVVTLLLVGGAGVFLWLRSSSRQVQVAVAQTHTVEESLPVDVEPVTDEAVPPEVTSESPPPISTNEPIIDEPVEEPEEPVAEPAVNAPPVAEPEEPAVEVPAPVGPPAHIAALFPELQSDGRQPLPSANVSKEKTARIAQIFHVDEARTAEAKTELAQRMLQTGRETVDDADSQYELLNQSRLLAANVGDVETALAATSELTKRFQVDGDVLSAATISQLLDSPVTNARRKEIVDHGLAIVDQCLGGDHYVEAAGLIKDLLTAARRNRDLEQIAALSARQKIGSELFASHKNVLPAIERLRAEPNDAVAALAAGKFYALAKGDWRVGLPLLAAGSNTELQRLAEIEMQIPADSATQQTLADGWYAVAGSDKGTEPDRERARARMWYGKAVTRLSGLPKVEVEQRLEELAKVTLDGGAPYDATAKFAVATPGESRKMEAKVRDLFAIIAEQPLEGEWQFDQQGRLMPIGRTPRMQIPVALPSEYLLEAVVVDLTPQQPGIPLAVTLGQGQRAFQIDFDSRQSKREYYTGVQPVDGVQSSLNALAFRSQVMRADRPNLVRCLVGEKRFGINVNGVDVIVFEGDMRRIGSEQRDVVANIFLHPNRHEWALASLKLVALSDDAPPADDEVAEVDDEDLEPGEIDLTPPDDAASEPADGKIKEINFGKRLGENVVAGNWKGRGPQLHVAAFDGPALYQLPIKPAPEYHLQIDLTRRGKGSELAIGLVYHGVQCVVALDRDEQTSSAIVGHSLTGAGDKDFVISRETDVLPASTRVKIDCFVHEDSFSVSVDGEKFLEFTGDANWDGPGQKWQPRDSDVLFLGANNAEFDIRSVRLGTTAGREADAPSEDVGP